MTASRSTWLRLLTAAAIACGAPLLAQAQSISQLHLHAAAQEAIQLGAGVGLKVQKAEADYESPAGQWGDATTVALPSGSHAGIGLSAWHQGWQVSSQALAGVASLDPHSGATAGTTAEIYFSIQQPGSYQLWLDALPSMAPTPGQGSSFEFVFTLTGDDYSSGVGVPLTVFDITTADPLHLMDLRYLPLGDYRLALSADVVMSARADPALGAMTHFGLAPVPEPRSAALLAGGLSLLVLGRRARRRPE